MKSLVGNIFGMDFWQDDSLPKDEMRIRAADGYTETIVRFVEGDEVGSVHTVENGKNVVTTTMPRPKALEGKK